MQNTRTANPYKFIEELLENIKEELKQKPELNDAKEERLLMLAEREIGFSLALIRKLEGNNKTTSKVVKYRKYLELLTKEKRQPPAETVIKIKRLFLYLMNQSNNQPITGTTKREKRFSRYDASIRTSQIRHSTPSTNKRQPHQQKSPN